MLRWKLAKSDDFIRDVEFSMQQNRYQDADADADADADRRLAADEIT